MPTKTPADPAAYMDLRLIAGAGASRASALAKANSELDVVIDELERTRKAGGRVNITLAAELAHVNRTTLYARLRARQNGTP